MDIETLLKEQVKKAIESLYGQVIDDNISQLQKTRKEFKGDITLVTFPFLKISRKSPEQTGNDIGNFLKMSMFEIESFNVIKGYLNFVITSGYWINFLNQVSAEADSISKLPSTDAETIMVEYSSPNTNKPLHLGHVRNNLLGFSVCNILKATGKKVIKANLVNDRGIHICKSMLAWQRWGGGITPEKAGVKGDHLVGDYYVKFDQEYKKELKVLIDGGLSEEEAAKCTPLMNEAQEMLRKWEARDPETIALWKTMNGWVYDGFDITYKTLGVNFDKIYYESETYLLGKSIVQEGLAKGVLYKRDDGSVWIDLTNDGLDEKLLLRSDGTSVYMTQDIGTAQLRFSEYPIDKLVYVVGNEQNYHFQVLALVLQKLGYPWAKNLVHLSYGMVELPSGKMKSREGTVVDADDLMDEMFQTARDMSNELGKLDGLSKEETDEIVRVIGLGALKYFILKVDPKKNMTFNPAESIDFNGNTGPFIQYTYARIRSVVRKAIELKIEIPENIASDIYVNEKELELIKLIVEFEEVVKNAAAEISPAIIANYVYELAREFNQFYHEYNILKEEDVRIRNFRLLLSKVTGKTIKNAMNLLGIEVPERM
jgi:arginyl-tRNA synthetase